MYVCPDGMFWTTEHFVTTFGMVIQCHEPEWHAEKRWLLSSRSRSQRGLVWSKYDSFYFNFVTADSLASRLGLIIYHRKTKCLVKKNWITAFKVKVAVKAKHNNECLFRWCLLNHQTFCYQTWYMMHYHELECHAKGLVCYVQAKVTAMAHMVKVWRC